MSQCACALPQAHFDTLPPNLSQDVSYRAKPEVNEDKDKNVLSEQEEENQSRIMTGGAGERARSSKTRTVRLEQRPSSNFQVVL